MFEKYRKKEYIEMRPITDIEIKRGATMLILNDDIKISSADIKRGSPKTGDMIARKPTNITNQWLVEYSNFIKNYEKL